MNKEADMYYRAVGGRCAVNLRQLRLPIPNKAALDILEKKGFELVAVDIPSLAKQCVGTSTYRRGAQPNEAPTTVDCSSLIKWLYAERGIWLPRRSIQQRESGELVDIGNIRAGDVIFTSGRVNYYRYNRRDGVGHVGIYVGNNTVVHAANSQLGVVETPLEDFVDRRNWRGIKRYIEKDAEVITLQTPPHRGVETDDDIRWIILQTL